MWKRLPILSAMLLISACASVPRDHTVGRSPLLDGQELFGVAVPAAGEADILKMSDEMRAFVDRHGREIPVDWLRMRHLLQGMDELGYLSLKYDSGKTLTAAEVFRERRGNCLSFTNLFVALARDAGLDAQYQIVEVPPIWDSADGWVMLNSHINVVVHRVKMSVPDHPGISRDYVVDFNTPEYQGTLPRRAVPDRTAFALFYSNRGVEAMRAGDPREAFANFKLAIAKDPTVASTWVNLGALYSRQQRYDSAKAVYEIALGIDPNEKSALTNLARVCDELGYAELASTYRQRVRAYEDHNPYHHYALAQSAYRDANYDDALSEIRSAISLKRDDHRFYFLEGLIHYRRGDVSDARSSIAMAERLSSDDNVKERYADKLAALGLKNG